MSVTIDANLLFVWVVSKAELIGHPGVKGCGEYDQVDADAIDKHLSTYSKRLVTTHVLTEVSNLIGRCRSHLRASLFESLRRLVTSDLVETTPQALKVMSDEAYSWLGLTDIALSQSSDLRCTVFTNDRNLHILLLHRGIQSIHYDHMIRPRTDRR